jgi:serine/threonine-protein kinase
VTRTGTKVGKYTLKDQLGQGGYGDVYLGVAKGSPDVAVKLLDPSAARDEDTVARFKREADTARRLEHRNIVQVVDVGSSRGRHYIVMELVRGGSLRKLLRRNDAPPEKLLSVLTDVADALAFAHEKGVVHRDVKPENVLLTRSGKAKVADFGLARAVDHSSLTTDGRLLGTAVYMSPEQATGNRATAASDVYAFGVILYEAIAGTLPFKSDSQIGFLYQHAEIDPPRPELRAPFPSSLAALALECLAKDPDKRPSMARVAERLAATTLRRPRRIGRVIAIAAAALVLVTAIPIAAPGVLDPLCGDWFGAPPFRAARRGARAAHDAIFGGSHDEPPKTAPPHADPPHHKARPRQ